jgi:hypothetical protein
MAFDPKTASIEELGNWLGGSMDGSINRAIGTAEFLKRQTKWQIEAAQAQIRAANAEEEAARAATAAAHSAEKNAKYMLWSVIAAAGSAFISLVSTVVTIVWK